jgi:hypothetical protein
MGHSRVTSFQILNPFTIRDHIHNSFADFILCKWNRVSNDNETWNIACFAVHYFGTFARIFTKQNHFRNPIASEYNHHYITNIFNLLMLIISKRLNNCFSTLLLIPLLNYLHSTLITFYVIMVSYLRIYLPRDYDVPFTIMLFIYLVLL